MAEPAVEIRPAGLTDVPAMARVLVQAWRETYRGLMPDSVLDDPGLVPKRERYWTAALTDSQYAENRTMVAGRDSELIGVAMSGPPLESGPWDRQLYALYVLRSARGSGAGRELLDAVLDPAESAVLWVADPNPRAQAFYRREGFAVDGGEASHDGVPAVRMVRGSLTAT